jgi:hypothetical protein
MKFIILIVSFVFLCYGLLSSGVAQVAVEYGAMGSKTSPKCLGCSKKVQRNTLNSVRRTTPSSKVEKSKLTRKPQPSGRYSGPLIIEKRGDHYERIN